MQLPDEAVKMGAPPHWLAYIGTPDVDKTVAQATKLGRGPTCAPQDIPTVGRFAVIADPQGATIAFYTPLNEQPPSHAPDIGDVSWHELTTTDLDGALRFYQQLAGWEQTGSHDMGAMGPTRCSAAGLHARRDVQEARGHAGAVALDDLHPGAGRPQGGGPREGERRPGADGPHEVPGGDWIVQCRDPQGAIFALHQRKAG